METLDMAVRCADDVVMARQQVKRFAARLPFGTTDLARIELAVAELATNLVKHARGGRLTAARTERDGRHGIVIVATDDGPGIPDLPAAQRAGFSTTGTFGAGLGAIAEHMDEFGITSDPATGTRVEVRKWLP